MATVGHVTSAPDRVGLLDGHERHWSTLADDLETAIRVDRQRPMIVVQAFEVELAQSHGPEGVIDQKLRHASSETEPARLFFPDHEPPELRSTPRPIDVV